MMDIIDHGEWVTYKPESYPIKLPSHIIFARRVSDGADWYMFRNNGLIAPDSIKMTLMQTDDGLIVLVTSRDISEVFPAGRRLIEVRGVTDDHETFRQHRFDLDRKRFLPPLPRPPTMTQVLAEELGIDEAKLRARYDAAVNNRRKHG